MDPEIKKAFEQFLHERDTYDTLTPRRLCETGIAYEAKWVSEQFNLFAAGFCAARGS